MRVVRVTVDLVVPDLDATAAFFRDYLGLIHEDPVPSVKVDDVDEAYTDAQRRGLGIVHPLTTEPWGIRRFFVRAPGGPVLDIAQHHDREDEA